MMARWILPILVSSLIVGSGCCCVPNQCGPCGTYGGASCICLPRPIVWEGGCNECAPPGQSCGDCCFECGLFPFLRRGLTCGKGCGEVYVSEWISDPPDCCDPCDQCGNWTGPQGYCHLGPLQRVLAALHGYRYCPRPNCGPWAPLCSRGCGGPCGSCGCGPVCGCEHCGGAGCASCGQAAHGASIYYDGPMPAVEGTIVPQGKTLSILNESGSLPQTTPATGRPIQKAQQMPRRPQSAAVLSGKR
jgi:hypothetical protein